MTAKEMTACALGGVTGWWLGFGFAGANGALIGMFGGGLFLGVFSFMTMPTAVGLLAYTIYTYSGAF